MNAFSKKRTGNFVTVLMAQLGTLRQDEYRFTINKICDVTE